jgi:hypothetical protein
VQGFEFSVAMVWSGVGRGFSMVRSTIAVVGSRQRIYRSIILLAPLVGNQGATNKFPNAKLREQ